MSIAEEMGMTYRQEGDVLLPNLRIPDEDQEPVGKYGRIWLSYLKEHKRLDYNQYLLCGELMKRARELDQEAGSQVERISSQMAKTQGVNEEMKASDQMRWVGLMNNIKHSAEEIVLSDLIYK